MDAVLRPHVLTGELDDAILCRAVDEVAAPHGREPGNRGKVYDAAAAIIRVAAAREQRK